MVLNVHSRAVRRDPEWLARAIDRVAESDSELWPSDCWPPLVLDRPLAIGADGGHGPIRYSVVEYEPGRRVVFRFAPETGLHGTHTLELLPGKPPGVTIVRHEIRASVRGRARLIWMLAVRWLHGALIEDLLDRAEFPADRRPAASADWSPWVRLLRNHESRKQQRGDRASATGV